MRPKPMVILGEFWQPVLECVHEMEASHDPGWRERNRGLIHAAATPEDTVDFLRAVFTAGKSAPEARRALRRRNSRG